ncbi:hypothetical protein UK23_18200 [Lentzea aerocolonigenes]|uniref:Uncharacterized protein n=1 Tax=Lentzea aerocolonigenes TaxID=68170 RepID=A0A0F0H347_LENAE|nr:hypothetical protein [Lentzea aerocolonigenes]KJK48053.1 hypothetical protein UK23_18200 [Lentzea aerocolonigenes]
MTVSERIAARVGRDFGERASEALAALALAETGNQDVERVHAALVLMAEGSVDGLWQAVELSAVDWRDVLMNGGLAAGDWPEVLEREFGPVSGVRS